MENRKTFEQDITERCDKLLKIYKDDKTTGFLLKIKGRLCNGIPVYENWIVALEGLEKQTGIKHGG